MLQQHAEVEDGEFVPSEAQKRKEWDDESTLEEEEMLAARAARLNRCMQQQQEPDEIEALRMLSTRIIIFIKWKKGFHVSLLLGDSYPYYHILCI